MLRCIVKCIAVVWLTGLFSSVWATENLLRNPDLSQMDVQKNPAEWKFSKNEAADASVQVLPGAGPKGENILSIINHGPQGRRAALRQFLPLKAGVSYRLSCRAKGKAGQYLSFALGSKWQKRLWVRSSEEWTVYSLKFSPDESEFSWKNAYEICLLSEDACDIQLMDIELAVDDPAVLLVNGDFAKVDAKGYPEAWKCSATAGMDFSVKVLKQEGPGRRNVLAIDNNSNHGGGRLAIRQFVALKAGQEYELSCKVRGRTGGYLSFALGSKWRKRLWLRQSDDWREYRLKFTAEADEFSWQNAYEICLLSEDICHAQIADVALTPLNEFTPVAAGYSRVHRVAVIPRTVFKPEAVAIPAELPLFEPDLVEKYETPSKEDLSCQAALGYDETGLIFYAAVTDGGKFFSRPGEAMWNGDCVQLALEPDGRLKEGRGADDLEIGFTRYHDKPDQYCWTLKRKLTPDEIQYEVRQTDNGYFVAARISWQLMPQILKNPGGSFSFNLTVNDCDDNDKRRAISLAPGIFVYKSNRANTLAFLEDKPFSVRFLSETKAAASEFRARLVLGTAAAPVMLRAENAENERIELPLVSSGSTVPAVAGVCWDLRNFSGGEWKIHVIAGNKTVASAVLEKRDFYREFLQMFARLRKRYAGLKPELEKKSFHPRFRAIQAIFKQQIELLDADITKSRSLEEKDYYGWRGSRILNELNELADFAEKLLCKKLPSEHTYVSSRRVLRNGWLEAETVGPDGMRTVRPVIFSGYGHFDTAVRSIPFFSAIGADMIQFELPMSSVMQGEKPDGSFQINFDRLKERLAGIDTAWKNNVTISLLLGTHYLPDWAKKAHPEILWNSGSFLQFDIQHPFARKLVGEFVRQAVRQVRSLPGAEAIHSICISNEPRYQPSLRSEFTRQRFLGYLKRLYGDDIAKLNSTYGTKSDSFTGAVPHYDPRPETQPGLFFDFTNFKLDEFADWHRWMADIVHEEWPGMIVHSKVLGGFGIGNATDYERFGSFSPVNGTDNGIGYNQRTKRFTRGEMVLNLASSMNPATIVNSENHLIPDDVEDPVSYDAVYCCAFQQYLHGVAGSAVWVWEDYDLKMFREHHSFVGNIYRRPMGILAVRDAAADANRLVEELKAACAVPAQVALLYSVPSAMFNEKYEPACWNVWQAFARAGRKVRFISESQLQRGETAGIGMIVAAETSVIAPETAEALRKFAVADRPVITLGHCFEKTPYGKPLSTAVPVRQSTVEELGRIADSILGRLPVQLHSDSPQVEWRATPEKEGTWLVNVVNFGEKPAEVALSADGEELIRGTRIPAGRFLLPAMQPMLLRISLR